MVTDAEIQQFVEAVQAKHDERFRQLGYTWTETYSFTTGPRYIRVIQKMPGQTSVFCFVDRSNGDILMAAGYKGPAKRARGNIANGVADLTPDGRVKYLR